MTIKRGFNRLFWVATLVWVTYCTVVYPLQLQWEGQEEASKAYKEANKNCDQLVVELPNWALTKTCYEDAMSRYQTTLEKYSFKNFWAYPVVFWRLFLPVIVLPPLAVYGFAALSVWICRGFKPRLADNIRRQTLPPG